MNKFEEKVKCYEDYLKEKDVLAQMIKNKDQLIEERTKMLREYSDKLKDDIRELKNNVKQQKFNLDQQKQKLESKISAMSTEEITKTMLEFINKKQNDLKIEQGKIDNLNAAVKIKEDNFDKSIKIKEQELLIDIEKKSEEIKIKQQQVNDTLLKVKNSFPKIKFDEMQNFLIDYLNKVEHKQFYAFKELSNYHGTAFCGYEEYDTDVYFYGIKCTNKHYEDKESMLKGMKKGEVILFSINENEKWRGCDSEHYNLFHIPYDIEYTLNYSKRETLDMPILSLVQGEINGVDFLKIFPGLKEALLNLFKEKIVKQENQNFKNQKTTLENLKESIISNEERMQKEINTTVENIKKRYKKELANDKIKLLNTASKLIEQKNIVNDLKEDTKKDNKDIKNEVIIDEYEIN